MGLKISFKGLPSNFKGLKVRTSKPDASVENPAVYAVTATAVEEEEEGTGLTPPPAALAAPWAVKPAVPVVEATKAPLEIQPSSDARPAASKAAAPVARPEAAKQNKQAAPVVKGSSLQPAQKKTSSVPKAVVANAQPAQPATTRAAVEGCLGDVARGGSKPTKGHKENRTEAGRNVGEASSGRVGDEGERAEGEAPVFRLPPAIQLDHLLQREGPTSHTESETDTPMSAASTALESVTSTGTVVVTGAHQAHLSLSLTASIEDYAKKADPANWGPPKFRKSQFVRIAPGTYPVPFKKLSEARSQYTNLEAFTKGTIHQINKETDTRDPREFVADEGLVLYRVWVPRKVNSNVEFIFVEEEQMTVFRECTFCSAYATEQCGGCKKDWYCSEECLADDWRNHRHDCRHKGRTPPVLGERSAESVCSDTPASSITPRPGSLAGPRRKFREDGTVKIINGAYKPTAVELRGRTTIMPACLRPLTLDEELAPPPATATARILRAASHKLRRAIHKKRMRRQSKAQQQRVEEELREPELCNQTIPEEGDEEGSEGNGREEDPGAERRSGSSDDTGDSGGHQQPSADGNKEGEGDGAEGAENGGAQEGRRSSQEGRENKESGNGSHSSGPQPGGSNVQSLQLGRKASKRSASHKSRLGALKPAKSAVLGMQELKHGRGQLQISHAASFNSIFGKARRPELGSYGKSGKDGIVSGACSEPDTDEYGSALTDYDSDVGSPGAESLVEGQPPERRDRKRDAAVWQAPSRQVLMPQLPRIRTGTPQTLQGTLGSLPETGSAQERPVASAASLDKAGRQQSAEEAEKPSRSDSLPEVFKRLTSHRFASLGVRAAGDGGSPAATKPRTSPFKRHHPGHRVTLLGPSTGF